MVSPNLFDYATKELSQDAVICWLLAWAGSEAKNKSEEDLRRCGRRLVDALFAKWHDRGDVQLGRQVATKVLPQEHNIDVLARVNGQYVLLIEDKTNTAAHNDQLAKYWNLVVEGKTAFGNIDKNDLYPIYCKTGNYSLKDRQHAEDAGYRVFDRSDFLKVLEKYRGSNEIVLDFRRHLNRWERDTASFEHWTVDSERTSLGWEGFHQWIERNCLLRSRDHWGALGSLVGGYWGVWIEPAERSRRSKFEIWIEKDRISIRLYGAKGGVSIPGMNAQKQYWAKAFERGSGPFRRPTRLQATSSKPMCVAEWRGWLVYGDNGSLDLKRTAKNLKVARRILLATIKDSKA